MEVLGVILAGGQGKRMGTVDKGSLIFKDKPLAHHVYERLAPQVDRIIIAGPNTYGLPLQAVPDPLKGYHGPLMGLYAALKWNGEQETPADAIITAPVDCPFTPINLTELLVGDNPSLPLGPKYLAEGKQRHPTFALWPSSCLAALETALMDEDMRAMKHWIERIGAEKVPYQGAETLVNFNRPEDMK